MRMARLKKCTGCGREYHESNGYGYCFLNPMEQSIHNSGWFTVEQLEEWAKDSGPVMMKKEECRR
jgi:hypothetical protein